MSEHAVGRDEIDQYTQTGYLDARQRDLRYSSLALNRMRPGGIASWIDCFCSLV